MANLTVGQPIASCPLESRVTRESMLPLRTRKPVRVLRKDQMFHLRLCLLNSVKSRVRCSLKGCLYNYVRVEPRRAPCTTRNTSRSLHSKLARRSIDMDEAFKHHGLPSDVVSDRDLRFQSEFWKTVHDRLGIKVSMSTALLP
jgi:hypothetical protein